MLCCVEVRVWYMFAISCCDASKGNDKNGQGIGGKALEVHIVFFREWLPFEVHVLQKSSVGWRKRARAW
jgi:hypothetical protein